MPSFWALSWMRSCQGFADSCPPNISKGDARFVPTNPASSGEDETPPMQASEATVQISRLPSHRPRNITPPLRKHRLALPHAADNGGHRRPGRAVGGGGGHRQLFRPKKGRPKLGENPEHENGPGGGSCPRNGPREERLLEGSGHLGAGGFGGV